MGRLSVAKLVRLFRRDLPRPIDVVNLVTLADREWYAWYGLLVYPLVRMTGGRPLWAGIEARVLHGRSHADELLVVRYPGHRRFLVTTVLNPVYPLLNLLRVRGVERFEASLTHSEEPGREAELADAGDCLVAHFNVNGPDTPARVRRILSRRPARFVYSTREVATVDFLGSLRPTDPKPMERKHLAFFEVPDVRAAEGVVTGDVLRELGEATARFDLVLYRRADVRELLPQMLRAERSPAAEPA